MSPLDHFGQGPQMVELLKFPAPDTLTAREALQRALDEKVPLTNVIILSQRENGNIYHLESDGLALKDVLWLVESFKSWFMKEVCQ
jgi:hypothetical protein